jgi:pyrimidine deaminase RibD-like protein
MKIIDEGRINEAQERFDTIIKNAISNNDVGITEPETSTYINIFINSDNHYVEQLELSGQKKKIQVGRHNFCDITPTNKLSLSRLHLTIVHFMDDNGIKKFALLDMGSLLGLQEISNYISRHPEIIARQNRGVAWIRSVGESIHLKLGDDVTLLIQTSNTFEEIPKCTVCLDAKRVITLEPCNHFATCSNCSKMIDECPICRGNIQNKRKVNNLDNILCTFQPNP